MAKVKKSTALSQEKVLERALQAKNIVDMKLFFKYRNKSSEYWMSGMILILDNITTEQKIKLAHKIIKDEDVLAFFFKRLYGVTND